MRLTRYAVGDARAREPAGRRRVARSPGRRARFLLLRGASPVAAAATLLAGASAGVALTAQPFGVQALEVAGAGRLWPHVVGELAVGLALGALLVAVVAPSRGHRGCWPPAGLAPAGGTVRRVGAAGWPGTPPGSLRRPGCRRSSTSPRPAVVTVAVLGALALATGGRRADSVDQRVAAPAAGLGAAHRGRRPAGPGRRPDRAAGQPAGRRGGAGPRARAGGPRLLGGGRAGLPARRDRRDAAALRCSSWCSPPLVGAVFLVAANAVNLAAGTSVGSMVTGGVVALVLLPAALLLRRIVSRLRVRRPRRPLAGRLRAAAAGRRRRPRRTRWTRCSTTLSRSLELELRAASSRPAARGRRTGSPSSCGERRGRADRPSSCEVAGTAVGRLEMEVSPLREPFGPRDRRLLEDLGTQVGALVQACWATASCSGPGSGWSATREEERRRLRRDLHDGLGPSLATTLMRLEVAHDLVHRDPDAASRPRRAADRPDRGGHRRDPPARRRPPASGAGPARAGVRAAAAGGPAQPRGAARARPAPALDGAPRTS